MTDKKLTDSEIVEALKTLLELVLVEDCSQRAKTISKVLDLINRLQAEIVTEQKYADCLNAEIEKLREIRDLCNATILEKNEQIEKLKISDASKEECTIKQHGEIKELKAENEKLKKVIDSFTDIGKLYSEIKAEAYKECIEKVKEISKYETYCDNRLPAPIITYHITEDNLDNLLKELGVTK